MRQHTSNCSKKTCATINLYGTRTHDPQNNQKVQPVQKENSTNKPLSYAACRAMLHHSLGSTLDLAVLKLATSTGPTCHALIGDFYAYPRPIGTQYRAVLPLVKNMPMRRDSEGPLKTAHREKHVSFWTTFGQDLGAMEGSGNFNLVPH